jgi:hypothetical protein
VLRVFVAPNNAIRQLRAFHVKRSFALNDLTDCDAFSLLLSPMCGCGAFQPHTIVSERNYRAIPQK